MVQKTNPTKGDWVSKVSQLLTEYEINLKMVEIQQMKTRLYKSLVKRKVQQKAFNDLILKKNRGQKGIQILYEKHYLAPYLTLKAICQQMTS